MPTVLPDNISAVIREPKLSSAIEIALRAISSGVPAEITLSDGTKAGRIIVYDGPCAEHPDVSAIRNGIIRPHNRRQGTKYQISITYGRYGGTYGKSRTARTPREFERLQFR